jgi:hypothetical protein
MNPDDFLTGSWGNLFGDWGSGDIDFSGIGDLWGSGDIKLPEDFWGSGDIDFSTITPYTDLDQALIKYAERSGTDLATAQQKFADSGLTLDDLNKGLSVKKITEGLKKVIVGDDGKVNQLGILGLTALAPKLFGGRETPPPAGYQGSIPKYTAVRERVAGTTDPTRRSGSGGRRYFSDISYAPKTGVAADAEKDAATLAATKTAAQEQAAGLATLNTSNPAYEKRPKSVLPAGKTGAPVTRPTAASGVADLLPVMEPKLIEQYMADKAFVGPRQQQQQQQQPQEFEDYRHAGEIYLLQQPQSTGIGALGSGVESNTAPTTTQPPITAARGGLMNLARGRYLNGSSDGMADKIPATIEDKQPARLSHGEFVVPADVVSHLGNGNSEAGAQRLYSMMDKIRKARTGTTKQGKQINPNKYLPA